MELTKEKLEEFIREELDYNDTIKSVISDLEDVSKSLDDDIEKVEKLVDKLEGEDEKMKQKLEFFYYDLLDKGSDLTTFITKMKSKYE